MLPRILVACLLLLLQHPDADAAKRVALVIGNSKYVHTPALENPRNDASDMAAAFGKLGFQVVSGLDLDKNAFERKIREFAAALHGTDAGVFFYAGHGLQVGGQNFLVPVDAELSTADALDFEMIRLEVIHRTMERETKTNIIFLDACRNNPLARNLARAMGTRSAEIGHGLAPVESGVGTLISFSTQPGNVALDGKGRNSPFAEALIKRLSASHDDLSAILISVRNDVMKETLNRQVPWEHSALTGRFYFGDPPAPPVNADEVTWGLIKDATDPALFRRFVEQFPRSQRRAEAEKRAALLATAAPKAIEEPPKPAEKAASAPPAPSPPPANVVAPAEIAWSLIKDSKDMGLLRRFIEQFPDSARRSEAERRMQLIAAEAKAAPAKPAASGGRKCFTFDGRQFCQ